MTNVLIVRRFGQKLLLNAPNENVKCVAVVFQCGPGGFPPSTHLALHAAELLVQVAVELEEVLDLGLRGVQGALHLHELLHRDRSVGEV